MTRAEVGLNIWALASLVGGPTLMLLGARAAGTAVSASLVGSVIGFMVVSSNFDSLPYGGAIGATVDVVVGGLAGLFWKSPAKRSTLLALGVVVAVTGAITILGFHSWEGVLCFHSHVRGSPPTCYPVWHTWTQLLFASSAAFVALLCLVQPARRERDDLRATTSVGMQDSPHA
jgi:hypothetical protein